MSTANLDQSLETQVVHGAEHEEADHRMFGFIVFLLSESVIFLSFFCRLHRLQNHLGGVVSCRV